MEKPRKSRWLFGIRDGQRFHQVAGPRHPTARKHVVRLPRHFGCMMLAFPLSQRAAARYALDATWSHRSRVPTVELSRGLGCTCWLQAGVLEWYGPLSFTSGQTLVLRYSELHFTSGVVSRGDICQVLTVQVGYIRDILLSG